MSNRYTAAKEKAERAELRRFALITAREQFTKLITMFPELRDELPQQQEQRELREHVVKHWRKTQGATSTNGSNKPSGFRAQLVALLTSKPQTSQELRQRFETSGFPYTGKTSLGTRVPQELGALVRRGHITRTKRGFALKGGR